MKGLITFVMKGRVQAIAATSIIAILALLMTPLAVASAALIVLATLRNGAREGLIVALVAIIAITGFGAILFHKPMALTSMGLALWLPVWMLAVVLGQSGSLTKTLEATAIGGVLVVVAQYLLLADPTEFWGEMLREWMQSSFDPAVVALDEQKKLIQLVAGWMPGAAAATWMIVMSLAIFIGSWASAKLDDTKSFGEAFRKIRVGKAWLIALPLMLLFGVVLYEGEANFVGQLYLLTTVLFLIQGVSVVHALIDMHEAQIHWLFGLYFFMVIGSPYSVTAIAAAGYADGWIDFRARARARLK